MQDSLIAKRARQFEWATIGLLVLLVVAAAIAIADGGLSIADLREEYDTKNFPETPAPWAIMLWRVIEVASYILLLWVLWCVRGWLSACADGETFQGDTARRVLRIGQGLLALAVVEIVSRTIIILALTWNNPPGERTLSITIDGSGLFMLLAAALLTLFGYIQSEAARLMAENREFI
ncbi:DUF2975 domain-containing protein [Tateyamaria omphalii]|uniref:DUF2975 domain-containing protein n=1 Tax=Tateyamaria omphalii TaxID=299262 RepID=UPI001C995A17|nr:DUF2975 domain-containing protein [Tateyamaria omphalii]MBY5933779.1 DUF2975 domain-containing protein [Tateyamaria omphalii]